MATDYGSDKKAEPDLEEQERVEKIFARWQDARDGLNAWRSEARENYGFVAGNQWSDDDIARLMEQERPNLTFNRMDVMVDAVCGLEVNARQQITYFPREPGDAVLAEIETAAAKWVIGQCHGEEEDSDAFRDSVICGIGATEMRMDYEKNADGDIVMERRDPLKTFYDPAASKRCLTDSRYVFYADWMDNREIEDTWPDKYSATTPWDRLDEAQRPQNADLQFLYKDTDSDFDKHKDQSLVIQYQCHSKEAYYRVLDSSTGEIVDIDKDKFTKIRKAYKEATGQDLQFVKQMRRVYWRGFYCGRTELEWKKSPYQKGFTFKFITAKRDRNKKMWYGIVRAMKDPQKWANKWLSQILHIINTNAKGGAFVETNALKDPRKAEEQWAASNPLIELNEGGIEKIRERTPAATPAGLDKLMTFAFESLPYVSGINLEALGLANREQAGVLEAQRRKSAYGILAPLFDALRLYRKQQGEMLLWFIREFISDGRLVRVLGEGGMARYAPLMKKKDAGEYDLVIDQAPDSPDFREKTWEAQKEILPVALKTGLPLPPSFFDSAPLPFAVQQEWKKILGSQGHVPPQVQQQMQQMSEALQKAGEEIQGLRQKNSELSVGAQVDVMKIHNQYAQAHEKNVVKVHQSNMQASVDRANALLDAHVKTLTSHLDRKSEENRHITKLIADFKTEVMKQSQGEGSRGTIVVDAASAIAKPVAQVLSKVDGAMTSISDSVSSIKKMSENVQKTHEQIQKIHADSIKPRKRKGKAIRQSDGSYTLESEG